MKIPNKAKLITDGGFYKIVENPKKMKYSVTLIKEITIASPETNVHNLSMTFSCDFYFKRNYRGYAEYHQYGSVNIIK